MPVQLLAFDCDGVILESMDVKSDAYARLAEPFGSEAMDRIRVFHALSGGVNRREKFRWMYQTFAGREPSPAELDDAAARFAELIRDGMRRTDLVPGILDVLERWHGQVPMVVCSGAPQKELAMFLTERGLAGYFDVIGGAPPSKTPLLRNLVQQAGVDPDAVIMIGDSFTDLAAARAVGTRFYGRGERFAAEDVPWHADMTRFNAWLEGQHI
ncbi:MAG TPA: HAD family hydrolase [Candidatus Avidesulfovibrio excrementigallinarum]|nr:HAD family hydrolase [Candidatus Avidesulfovibrio excrementigallinarum]